MAVPVLGWLGLHLMNFDMVELHVILKVDILNNFRYRVSQKDVYTHSVNEIKTF
jgi:hypothetical protein